jgi:hypothetical protein
VIETTTHRGHDGARDIGDDGMPGADFIINGAWQRVAMAVRFPVHGIFIARQRFLKGAGTNFLIILRSRRMACDHAAWKDNAAILGEGGPGKAKQGILARAARPDHGDQPTRPDCD